MELRPRLLRRIMKLNDLVRCTCGETYKLSEVEVTARYADCSVWKAPCCGRTADDRWWNGVVACGWSRIPDYENDPPWYMTTEYAAWLRNWLDDAEREQNKPGEANV